MWKFAQLAIGKVASKCHDPKLLSVNAACRCGCVDCSAFLVGKDGHISGGDWRVFPLSILKVSYSSQEVLYSTHGKHPREAMFYMVSAHHTPHHVMMEPHAV